MFFILKVGSIISSSIRICFNTLTMFLIILPRTFVFFSFLIQVGAKPVLFTIHPLSLICVLIYMSKFSLARCKTMIPLTFIFSTIRPYHWALTVSESSIPLSRINRTCWILKCFIFNSFITTIIFVLNSLLHLWY